MLTVDSKHSTQSSKLNSGQPPRSYGAFQPNAGTSFYGPAPGPSPHIHSAAPRPSPPPVHVPFESPIPRVISRGLAVCFAIMLLQTVLIICTSDTLAESISLESAAFRASRETSALVAEREKSEREREKLRREREFWEKVPEDRVPQGAFWEVVWPAWVCRAYGKREYWGMLRNIPQGWSAIDACMNMPVEIKGVTIRRPDRCKFVDGSPHIHGYWIVDWDEQGCKPWYRDFRDAVSPKIPFPFAITLRSHSYAAGMHELQVRCPTNRGTNCKDNREERAGLVVNVRKHPIDLEPDQLYEPYALRGTSKLKCTLPFASKANFSHDSVLVERLRCGMYQTKVVCD